MYIILHVHAHVYDTNYNVCVCMSDIEHHSEQHPLQNSKCRPSTDFARSRYHDRFSFHSVSFRCTVINVTSGVVVSRRHMSLYRVARTTTNKTWNDILRQAVLIVLS